MEPEIMEPTVIEPTVIEPTVVEPTIIEPTIIEPTIPQPAQQKPSYGSKPEASMTDRLHWKHVAPAFAPWTVFLGFLCLGRFLLRLTPDIPPISLLPPALVLLILTFFLSDWLTKKYRARHLYVPSGVWSRQALRNSLASNILYTFLCQGSFSTFEFLSGMFFNYMGTMAEENLGKDMSLSPWKQLKSAIKTFVIILVVRLFMPSVLSLDSILAFFSAAYQRATFNSAVDFTADFVAEPFSGSKTRLQALGLITLQAVIFIFLLLPTPFFQSWDPSGANCPTRWTALMFTYYCQNDIRLNDPLALYKEVACTQDIQGVTRIDDAAGQLSRSADYVAAVCSGQIPLVTRMRACQQLSLTESFLDQSPTTALTYVKAMRNCADALGGSQFSDLYDDAIEVMKVIKSKRRTSFAGVTLDDITEAMLIGAMPISLMDKVQNGQQDIKTFWTKDYM